MALEEVTAGIAQPPPVTQGPATEIISGVAGWAVLHTIADSGVSRFESEFVKAAARASSGVNRAAIQKALKGRNRQKALQLAVDSWKTQSQELKATITKELTDTVAKAATAVSKRVLTNPSAIQFDSTNPLATKWVRSQAGLLTDVIGEDQVKTIRNVIAQGFEDQPITVTDKVTGKPKTIYRPLTPKQVERRVFKVISDVKSNIGLQSRQEIALKRFEQDLIKKKVKPSRLKKRVATYRKKLLRRRARSIARTELMRASNMGQQLLWEESISQGHLDPSVFEKVWITTPDDRLCSYCRSKNGDRVGVFDAFNNPIAGGNAEPQPPLHPMCRCSTALVRKGKGVQKVKVPTQSTPTTGKITKPKKPEPAVTKPSLGQLATQAALKADKAAIQAVTKAAAPTQPHIGISEAWTRDLLTRKVGPQKGSNLGGVYADKGGNKFYVKQYKNPDQAATEAIANKVYRELGIDVPDSAVRSVDGKTYFVSRWMDDVKGTIGDLGMTADDAAQILDGFIGDVFTANWDAVGTGLDNVVRLSSGKIARIDQGGSLLFRAKGTPKPSGALGRIDEWEKFIDDNPYYKKVFDKAGLKSADELAERAIKQIEDLIAMKGKHGSWTEFVHKIAPELIQTPSGFQNNQQLNKIATMFKRRFDKLVVKRYELKGLTKTPEGWVKLTAKQKDMAYTKAMAEKKAKTAAAKQPTTMPLKLKTAFKDHAFPMQEVGGKYIAPTFNPNDFTAKQLNVLWKNRDKPPYKLVDALEDANFPSPTDPGSLLLISLEDAAYYKKALKHSMKEADLLEPASKTAINKQLTKRREGWPIADDVTRKLGAQYQHDVTDHYKAYMKSMSTIRKGSINDYTQLESRPINNLLRERPRILQHERPNLKDMDASFFDDETLNTARRVSAAIREAPKPPPPELVWRGIKSDFLSDFKDGDVFDLNGFQSSSIQPKVGARFGSTVMEIKPTHGMYIKTASEYSKEFEFLLPHSARYRLLGRKTIKFVDPEGRVIEREVLQLEMIPKPGVSRSPRAAKATRTVPVELED